MLQLPLNLALDQNATLDNFFSGENQQIVHALRQSSKVAGQMFFVYGQTGSGKSHLAQAVSLAADSVGISVSYLPLSNSYLQPEMLDGLGQMQLVVVDNFELISDRQDWQTAFFNLYNQIRDAGHSLIIFSRDSITELSIALADLVSRLQAMEIYQVRLIAEQNLADFVQWRGQRMGLSIAADVSQFILNRISRHPKELMLCLQQLDQASLAKQRRLTIPFVKQVLAL